MARLFSFLLALIALAAGGGAIVTAWVRMLEANAPRLLATSAPWSTAGLLAREDRLCLSAQPCDEVQLASAAAAIWQSASGSIRPLLYGAYRAAQTGNLAQATLLAERALVGDPRNQLAHAILADARLGAGDAAGALFHLDRLLVLRPEKSDAFFDAVAHLAAQPGGMAEIEKRLAQKPAWSRGLVTRLNTAPIDLAALLRLNQYTPETQSGYIQRILKEQGPTQALLAWLAFLPRQQITSLSWPYDPEFKSLKAPEPFNWSYDRGLVSFETGGGLFVTYDGRSTATLASQMMVIQPGAYRLEAMLQSEGQETGGRFAWVASCYPNGPDLARIVVGGEHAQPKV
ncbi:MAG: hypothetical protein ACOYJ6_19080, partial [Caulobacterales bacterium]